MPTGGAYRVRVPGARDARPSRQGSLTGSRRRKSFGCGRTTSSLSPWPVLATLSPACHGLGRCTPLRRIADVATDPPSPPRQRPPPLTGGPNTLCFTPTSPIPPRTPFIKPSGSEPTTTLRNAPFTLKELSSRGQQTRHPPEAYVMLRQVYGAGRMAGLCPPNATRRALRH